MDPDDSTGARFERDVDELFDVDRDEEPDADEDEDEDEEEEDDK